MGIEESLCKMNSFDAIKYVLNDIELHPLQCIDVMRMLYSKRAIVVYDTGLGKTVLAAAVMKLLWREDPHRKFIFIGMHDQLVQTPEKLERMCGRKVIATSGAAKDIANLQKSNFENYSVLFITHEALLSDNLMNVLFRVRDNYNGIFIDEAHELNNTGYARSATILAGMVRQFEYCYALTATPIISSVSQLAKLANIVDSAQFPSAKKFEREVTRGVYDIIEHKLFFINRTRQEFDDGESEPTIYNAVTEFVEPLPHQRNISNDSMIFQICKGEGAYPQVERLVKVIKDRSTQRGLIYIHHHEVREWVLKFLDEAGISYECINGTTSVSERARIMHEFNDLKQYDVIITSVTTAVDLDCDYVVFYEFTVKIKQMIGRAHRGLTGKTLDVVFIITDDSKEIDYFYNNIYKISMFIQSIMHHDYTEVEQVDYDIRRREEL